MKKCLATLSVLLILLSVPVPCFAVSKSEIMAEIEEGIVVNGQTVHAPANYASLAQNYLNSHDLTDAQLSRISSAVESEKIRVKQEMEEKENSTSGSDITSSEEGPIQPDKDAGQAVDNNSKTVVSQAGAAFSADTNESIVKSMGLGNKKLTLKQKSALGEAAVKVAEAAGATVTTNNKNVVIVDKDGNTYSTDQLNPIKATGLSYSLIPALVVCIALVFAIAACAVYIFHTRQSRKNRYQTVGGEE